ncbi:MAG: OmpA family protein [Chitinophagaceae bacterium]|nr:OmpA family protein [Chitinophagaceae bacterium]
MRSFLVAACYSLLPFFTWGQDLLANGSFEEENICTEYKVNCAPEAWITNRDGFSNYFKGVHRAHSGERFLAVEAGYSGMPFQRTFIRSRLLCGLRKGHQYRLQLFIKSPHAILDSIGVLFTAYDFLFGQRKLQNLSPSIFLRPEKGEFTRDSNWQKVSLVYTATGEESFISLAYFARKDLRRETGIPKEKRFFVYVDDISLMPEDPRESICYEWNANRTGIYEQDERHEFLRQKVRQNMDNPPTVVNPTTRYYRIDTLLLPDVLFASGKAELQRNSHQMLDEFSKRLTGKEIDSIVVEGHTDNTGTASGNEKLSVDRANAVEAAIRQRVSPRNLTIVARGWADRKPLTGNNSVAGRQQNRRVELLVYIRE